MFTAESVMDASAALLNDASQTIFTDAAQLPYLNIAIDELQEICEQNNISSTNAVESSIVVLAGAVEIPDADMPDGLVEIRALYERDNNSSEDYQLMRRVEFLPPFVDQLQELIYWTWQEQKVKFIGATTDRQVRIQYIKRFLTKITYPAQYIFLKNAKTFLEYRTAALCADYVGENTERASSLNTLAQLAIDRFVSVNTKGKQSIFTRRRPFMAGYKVRTGF